MDLLSRISRSVSSSSQAVASEDEANKSSDRKSNGHSDASDSHPRSSTSEPHSKNTEPNRSSSKATAQAFRNNWLAIRSTLVSPDQAALHHGIARTDLAARLQSLSDALVSESNLASEDADVAGPCMEMLLEGDILGQLVRLTANDQLAGTQAEVVKMFASLIILLDEKFLSRQAVHRPLVRLMRICVGDEHFPSHISSQDILDPHEDQEKKAWRRFGRDGSAQILGFEEELVDLMCHVASRLRNTPELLIIFFRECGGDEDARRAFNRAMTGSSGTPSRASTRAPSPTGSNSSALLSVRSSTPVVSSPLRPAERSKESLPPSGVTSPPASTGLKYDFPLFSYLMRFVHRESRTGELARAGILFLVDVAFAPGRRNLAQKRKSHANLTHGATHAPSSPAHSSPSTPPRAGTAKRGSSTPTRPRVDVDFGLGPSIALAKFMLESDFAEVLGAGIGAVYGLLPTKLALASQTDAHENMTLNEAHPAPVEFDSLGREVERTNSDTVRGQARLLCDLLEFTQDILRTTSRHDLTLSNTNLRPSSELISVGRTLTTSICTSLQTLFLESILYPSMLECSDADGSSVAVITYLDTIMSVVEDDSPLADCMVGWLVGREDTEETGKEYRQHKAAKHKSTAMLQLEGQRVPPSNALYYNGALGRYTIKDLLLDNLQPGVRPMAAIASLRLGSTLMTYHGRFALTSVVDVQHEIRDIGVIFAAEKPVGQASDADDDDHRRGDHLRKTSAIIDAHHFALEMDMYFSLLTAIENSHDHPSTNESTKSTGFDKYLEDAQVAVCRDSMFRHTWEVPRGEDHRNVCFPHRLQATDRLFGAILRLLCDFWRNSPDVNVALTGFLAAMAACPLRSSSGVFTIEHGAAVHQDAAVPKNGDGPHISTDEGLSFDGDDDDRSEDEICFAEADKAHKRGTHATKGLAPVVPSILHALVAQIEHHRRGIHSFDRYLGERKRGLLFVENLTEAMKVIDEDEHVSADVSPFSIYGQEALDTFWRTTGLASQAQTSHTLHHQTHRQVSLPVRPSATPSQGLDVVESQQEELQAPRDTFARFFGRAIGRSKASGTPSTPEQQLATALPPPKPFAQHYLQTSSILLDINVVRLSDTSPWSVRAGSSTPSPQPDDLKKAMTKRTRFKDDSEDESFTYPGEDENEDDMNKPHTSLTRTTSLSMFLDNVVVLQESVKELVALLQVRRAMGLA